MYLHMFVYRQICGGWGRCQSDHAHSSGPLAFSVSLLSRSFSSLQTYRLLLVQFLSQ